MPSKKVSWGAEPSDGLPSVQHQPCLRIHRVPYKIKAWDNEPCDPAWISHTAQAHSYLWLPQLMVGGRFTLDAADIKHMLRDAYQKTLQISTEASTASHPSHVGICLEQHKPAWQRSFTGSLHIL